MKIKIKEELLDTHCTCPLTGKITWVRTLELELYDYWYSHGRDGLFEIDEPIKNNETDVIS